ncbi:hypothetical protein THRCLA_00823, partial [Thraustotheca clavata]
MADEGVVLQHARALNSRLMKTNLGLLMAIRETDCDIVRAKKLLQKYHDEMVKNGVGIPQACTYQPRAVGNRPPPPSQPEQHYVQHERARQEDASDSIKVVEAPVAEEEPTMEHKSCPICLRVFDNNVKDFEIVLHEEECERVNGSLKKIASQKRRRPTESAPKPQTIQHPSPTTVRVPKEKITSEEPTDTAPPMCFICGTGGRQLLSCTGICARSFHIACIEENSVLTQRPFAAQRQRWKCAECLRNIHSCIKCGMLGDDNADCFVCSVEGCGFSCHQSCMGKDQDPMLYVCQRHTCYVCKKGGIPPSDCYSCYHCTNMVHKKCLTSKLSFKPAIGNFGNCGHHKREVLPLSLRSKLHPGNVVMILEMDNSLLPQAAKQLNSNQWGRVDSVENVEFGSQLVRVELFSCEITITITNQHALPVMSSDYENTPEFLQSCISAHINAELNIRGLAPSLSESARADVIMDTCLAFQHAGKLQGLSSNDMIELATHGIESWLLKNPTRPKYQFTMLDTRRREKPAALPPPQTPHVPVRRAPTRQSSRASTRASSR